MTSCKAIAITKGPNHHFFGYYNKSPWNPSMTRMLALRTSFMNHSPTADDEMIIGVVDPGKPGSFEKVGSTHTWNWQQSSMVQWLDDKNVLYNSRQDGHFVAHIVNVNSGCIRTLPAGVYHISPDKRKALYPNFARLHRHRPGYGYPGVEDPSISDYAPADDGVFMMDIETGERKLLVSLAELASEIDMTTHHHWVNHLEFNRDGSRFVFLHRWRVPDREMWHTRMLTMSADGQDRYVLLNDGMISHFDWRDASNILAWARVAGVGDRYFLFRDKTQERQIIADGLFDQDGHCSYSPDGRWILTDTYPDANKNRTLILYDTDQCRRIDIGSFYGPNPDPIDTRCDLHPRWSPDGKWVCFDSIHEGSRQMYIMNVQDVVG